MKEKAKYRSKVAEAVHEGVRGMHRLGLVDKTTMREFDVRTLTKIEDLSAKQIQALRERAGISQSVLRESYSTANQFHRQSSDLLREPSAGRSASPSPQP
jgi:DNA-binding transcriptional regulator YiaG